MSHLPLTARPRLSLTTIGITCFHLLYQQQHDWHKKTYFIFFKLACPSISQTVFTPKIICKLSRFIDPLDLSSYKEKRPSFLMEINIATISSPKVLSNLGRFDKAFNHLQLKTTKLINKVFDSIGQYSKQFSLTTFSVSLAVLTKRSITPHTITRGPSFLTKG